MARCVSVSPAMRTGLAGCEPPQGPCAEPGLSPHSQQHSSGWEAGLGPLSEKSGFICVRQRQESWGYGEVPTHSSEKTSAHPDVTQELV